VLQGLKKLLFTCDLISNTSILWGQFGGVAS
jgi:hypothetical protein